MPSPPGPPMDLENMRSLGVRSLMAYCQCGHEAVLDVSEMPGAVTVQAVGDRLRCRSEMRR